MERVEGRGGERGRERECVCACGERDKEILDTPSGVFSRLFDLPSHAFCFPTAVVAFEIKDFKCGLHLHGG